jgi:hypothetical protein
VTLGTNSGFEQQNTGTLNAPDGIHLTPPSGSPAIVIQTTSDAKKPPLIIDMFATVAPNGGPALTPTTVAGSGYVVSGKGLPGSKFYRVDGCVIGGGGCSIFPFTFLSVDPARLTQILIIRAPDQNDQNDPTLTARGNDETVQP